MLIDTAAKEPAGRYAPGERFRHSMTSRVILETLEATGAGKFFRPSQARRTTQR
jgi:hypothetical protein